MMVVTIEGLDHTLRDAPHRDTAMFTRCRSYLYHDVAGWLPFPQYGGAVWRHMPEGAKQHRGYPTCLPCVALAASRR